MHEERLGLAEIPAGPDLATRLAEIHQRHGELEGPQLVEVIAATQRLANWADALKVTAAEELAHCPVSIFDHDLTRTEERSEVVPGMLEVTLGWSRKWARLFDNLAHLLTELFPATHALLQEGLIDVAGARAIAEGLAVLDNPKHRQRIETETLEWFRKQCAKGRRFTTSTIAAHVEKAVIKVDPAAAKERHKNRVRQRDRQFRPSVDSVADLSVYNVPADRATLVFNRIDATARAVKQSGDQRTISQLRADIALSLLAGESRYYLPDELTFDDPHDTDAEDDEPEATAAESDDADTDGNGDGDSAEAAPDPQSTPAKPVPAKPKVWPAPGPAAVTVRAKNILHVSLTALLGLHEAGKADAAILGGFGPVIDHVAHRILDNHLDNPDADWAFVVTHPKTGKPLQLHPVEARFFTGRRKDAVTTIWPTCTWPSGCSRPAEMCIIDHSHDYALGGKTCEVNGDPVCRVHDPEKTKNRWRQRRPDRNTIIWINPFGGEHHVDAPTYEPEPEPEPAADADSKAEAEAPPDPGDDKPPF